MNILTDQRRDQICSYDEEGKETHIAIGADFDAEYIRRNIGNSKNILISNDNIVNKQYSFVISFDETEEKVIKRLADTINNRCTYITGQNSRYGSVMQKMPVLKSPYKLLNDFFVLAPLYHESCKVLC